MNSEESKNRGYMPLTKQTLIPLGLALSIFAGLYLQMSSITENFTDIKIELLKINNRIDVMEMRQTNTSIVYWTESDMRDLMSRLRSMNPTLVFPEDIKHR